MELLQGLDDALRLQQLQEVSHRTGIRLVAAGGVLMHVRSRKPLHDVLTAIKLGKTVHECGFELQANAEAHLRPRMRLADIYPAELLRATLEVAVRCTFNLNEIRNLYRYPQDDMVPREETPAFCLRRLTWQGAHKRYLHHIPHKIRRQVRVLNDGKAPADKRAIESYNQVTVPKLVPLKCSASRLPEAGNLRRPIKYPSLHIGSANEPVARSGHAEP